MKICLIDGYGLVFRAYYALPELTTKSGIHIGAIQGFISILLKLFSNNNINTVAVALDSGGKKTHRHKLYSNYKAHRPPLSPNLIHQLPIVREVLDAFGIKSLENAGVEADDIIASYTNAFVSQGHAVDIISGDKDLFQLVNNAAYVRVYDPVKDIYIDEEYVQHRYGITPYQMDDYLALIGDSSDNIPGVRGIGPKAACKLLKDFHSLDDLYLHIDEIQPIRVRNLLLQYKNEALLSKQLTTLIKDLAVPYTYNDLKWLGFAHNADDINTLLKKYSLEGISNRISRKINNSRGTPSSNNNSNLTMQALEYEEILEKIHNEEYFSIDVTATNFSVACNSYLCTNVNPVKLALQSMVECLKSLSLKKICYHMPSIVENLATHGVILNIIEDLKTFDDVMVMHYSLCAGKDDNKDGDIKKLYKFYCQSLDSTKEDAPHITHALLQLHTALLDALHKYEKVSLYYTIDKPLQVILIQMTHKGIMVDVEYLKILGEEFQTRMTIIAEEIFDIAGENFNLASPKQTASILFQKLKLQTSGTMHEASNNKDRPYNKQLIQNVKQSTNSEVLEYLAMQGHTIAAKIICWRQLSKLNGTYIDGLIQNINENTKRVHTTFNAISTSTGRITSNSPNLQSIPIKTEDGSKIRNAFVASPAHLILTADYSQIEIRVLAHVAKVESLCQVLREGVDVHSRTASEIFQIPLAEVTSKERRHAKAINFGIIYGMSSFGLAKNLGISIKSAQEYIKAYFEAYPEIQVYMHATLAHARKVGYITTIFGRRCYITDINSTNGLRRSFAERAAINAPIQGGAADIIRKAIVNLPSDIRTYLQLQIHDELLFEIPENKLNSTAKIIKQIMESIAFLRIPLTVNLKAGRSWGEAKPLE